MKYLKIEYRLLVYFTSFTVCSGDIKKKSSENGKKSSENHTCLFHFINTFPVPQEMFEQLPREPTKVDA